MHEFFYWLGVGAAALAGVVAVVGGLVWFGLRSLKPGDLP